MFIDGKYVPDTCDGCICVHCEKHWARDEEEWCRPDCNHKAIMECIDYEDLTPETLFFLTIAAKMKGYDLSKRPEVIKTSMN